MSFALGGSAGFNPTATNLGELPVLLGRRQHAAPADQDLPVLLGRRPTAARTLPSARSSAAGGEQLDLRPRARARFGTIRSFAMENAAPEYAAASVSPVPSILRPARVVLGTTDGVLSMCLLRDREARLHFVLAGLPAGPLLPEKEACAICLERFKAGDRIQSMANCRHVFHVACIEGLLRSRLPDCLMSDCVSCPLCRGPLLAASLSQLPQREQTCVTNIDAVWAHSGAANTTLDDASAPPMNDSFATVQAAEKQVGTQAQKVPFTRARTEPLGEADCKTTILFKRSATAPLDVLEQD